VDGHRLQAGNLEGGGDYWGDLETYGEPKNWQSLFDDIINKNLNEV